MSEAAALLAAGRLGEARAAAEAALGAAPDDGEELGVLGRVLARQGEAARAAAVLERAVRLAPGRAGLAANWAGALRRLGRVDQARGALARALALEPGRGELHFNLGNLESGAGHLAVAVGWYERAVQLDVGAMAASNLGVALRRLGRLDEGALWLERAVGVCPGLVEGWVNLSAVLLDLGRSAEALAGTDRGLALAPEHGGLLLNCGVALMDLGRLEAARSKLEAAVAAGPANVEAAVQLGRLARRQGDATAARHALVRAIALMPAWQRVWREYGIQLRNEGRHDAAAAVFRCALALKPDHVLTLGNLGVSLEELGESAAAERLYLRAAALAPHSAIIADRLGSLHHRQRRWRRSEAWYRRAIALRPDFPDPHFNLGLTVRRQGRSAEALAHLDCAVALQPERTTHRYERALALLSIGRGSAGFAAYDARWDADEMHSARRLRPTPSFRQPIWDGTVMGDQVLLVWSEQGLGDELWHSGYVGQLRGIGGRLIVECDPRLTPVLARSYPWCMVCERTAPPATEATKADLQCPMGDLALKLGWAERSAPVGYLAPDQGRMQALRRRYLRGAVGPLVGISWRSVKPKRERSFDAPLAAWDAVLRMSGLRFVSLQYGDVGSEVKAAAMRSGAEIVYDETVDGRRDIEGFVAQVAAVDLVVSIANVAVSAAHAVARPCFAALKISQDDWRFREDSEATPWLPLVRQYWQKVEGDWGDVFERIAVDLDAWRKTWPGHVDE